LYNKHNHSLAETEIYNAMTDQWTLVAPLPLPHSEGGSACYDGKLFVVRTSGNRSARVNSRA